MGSAFLYKPCKFLVSTLSQESAVLGKLQPYTCGDPYPGRRCGSLCQATSWSKQTFLEQPGRRPQSCHRSCPLGNRTHGGTKSEASPRNSRGECSPSAAKRRLASSLIQALMVHLIVGPHLFIRQPRARVTSVHNSLNVCP